VYIEPAACGQCSAIEYDAGGAIVEDVDEGIDAEAVVAVVGGET